MKKRAVFSLLMCACSQAFGSLSSAEQQAVDYIDAHHSQAVTLLEKSVNINSGTMNFEGVKKNRANAIA